MADSKEAMQFEVKLLQSAGLKFQELASDYGQTMKMGTPYEVPSSGAEAFDGIVKTVLQLFSEVHTEIADAVNNHGLKLQLAAQNYDEANQTAVNSLLKLARDGEFVPDDTSTID